MENIHEIDHEHKFINVPPSKDKPLALRGIVYLPPQKGLDELSPDATIDEQKEHETVLDVLSGKTTGRISRLCREKIGRAYPRIYPDFWKPTAEEADEIEMEHRISGVIPISLEHMRNRIKEYNKAFGITEQDFLTEDMEYPPTPKKPATPVPNLRRKKIVPRSLMRKLVKDKAAIGDKAMVESNATAGTSAAVGDSVVAKNKAVVGNKAAIADMAAIRDKAAASYKAASRSEVQKEDNGKKVLGKNFKLGTTATALSKEFTAKPVLKRKAISMADVSNESEGKDYLDEASNRIAGVAFKDTASLLVNPPVNWPITHTRGGILLSVMDKPTPAKKQTLINGYPAEWYQPSSIRWAPGALEHLIKHSAPLESAADKAFADIKAHLFEEAGKAPTVDDKGKEKVPAVEPVAKVRKAPAADLKGKEKISAAEPTTKARKIPAADLKGKGKAPVNSGNSADDTIKISSDVSEPSSDVDSLFIPAPSPSSSEDEADAEYLPDDDD